MFPFGFDNFAVVQELLSSCNGLQGNARNFLHRPHEIVHFPRLGVVHVFSVTSREDDNPTALLPRVTCQSGLRT